MEGDRIPEGSFIMEEVVGHEPVGIPMTEDQALYLQYQLDPKINELIANMDRTIKLREQSDAYQRRTLPGLNGS